MKALTSAILVVFVLVIPSGASGQLLYTLESPTPRFEAWFSWSVSGAGDVNGDGYDDVIVGAPAETGGALGSGKAYVFSGNGGALLYTLQSPNAEDTGYFGSSVSGAGDVNVDMYDDVVVGAEIEDGGAIDAAEHTSSAETEAAYSTLWSLRTRKPTATSASPCRAWGTLTGMDTPT